MDTIKNIIRKYLDSMLHKLNYSLVKNLIKTVPYPPIIHRNGFDYYAYTQKNIPPPSRIPIDLYNDFTKLEFGSGVCGGGGIMR